MRIQTCFSILSTGIMKTTLSLLASLSRHSLTLRHGLPRLSLALGLVAALSALGGCGGSGGGGQPAQPDVKPDQNQGKGTPTVFHWDYPAYTPPDNWVWELPAYMPPPRVPADNPMNAAKVELGRFLFYEKRLSGDGTLSCGGCHVQSRAFADGKDRPKGITGQKHPRNAQGLSNVAWHATSTWANPSLLTLERQIPNPVFGTEPVEMGVDESNVNEVMKRLADAKDVDYRTRFAQAFPEASGDPITWEHAFKAISAFERTMVSVDSRHDRFLQGRATLSAQELRGKQIFESAQCTQCHGGPNFNDQFVSAQTTRLDVKYHNIGLYNLNGRGDYPKDNSGAEEITGNRADMGAFRAPSLRNVAVSGPYMHDGSVATLEEAVRIMAGGGRNIESGPYQGDGRANPHKDPLVQDRRLSDQDVADIVAFLNTLTDETFLKNPAFSDPFAKTDNKTGSK